MLCNTKICFQFGCNWNLNLHHSYRYTRLPTYLAGWLAIRTVSINSFIQWGYRRKMQINFICYLQLLFCILFYLYTHIPSRPPSPPHTHTRVCKNKRKMLHRFSGIKNIFSILSSLFFQFAEEDYDAFCLAYMFTYRDFEMGTLGLAWTGDLKNAGGVCEKNGVSEFMCFNIFCFVLVFFLHGKIVLFTTYTTLCTINWE